MVEASSEERGDVRARDGAGLMLRTEWSVGQPGRADGWWVYLESDGAPFYEAGPFPVEQAAREAARVRIKLFEDTQRDRAASAHDELLREESVPPEGSER